MDVFQNMIESTGLLGSEIYEIQETWMWQHELEYTNYALKTLLKGLKFFHPVSPSESPKVLGLTSIHHPDTLCHFNGVTHCLWCGKEGQNEGMIINHLQMMYYKLGLVCEKCFCCPLVTSEAIQHHSQKSCQPSTEDALTSHLLQPNCKHKACWINIPKTEDQKEGLTSVGPPHQGCPCPINVELEGGSGRGTTICQTDACISFQSSCIMPRFQ